MPFMFQTLTLTVISAVLPIFFIMGAAIYIILRVRDARGSLQDPQLGVKFALHLLITIAAIIAINGTATIFGDLLSMAADEQPFGYPAGQGMGFGRTSTAQSTEFPSEIARMGFGMLVAGIVMAGAEVWLLYTRTNERKWPMTRRIFAGSRLLIHGLVVTALLTLSFMVAFSSVESASMFTQSLMFTALGHLAVWTAALAIDFTLLQIFTKQANIPGEDSQCLQCGTDLRGAVMQGSTECPTCEASVPLSVKRRVTSMTTGQLQPQTGQPTSPVNPQVDVAPQLQPVQQQLAQQPVQQQQGPKQQPAVAAPQIQTTPQTQPHQQPATPQQKPVAQSKPAQQPQIQPPQQPQVRATPQQNPQTRRPPQNPPNQPPSGT